MTKKTGNGTDKKVKEKKAKAPAKAKKPGGSKKSPASGASSTESEVKDAAGASGSEDKVVKEGTLKGSMVPVTQADYARHRACSPQFIGKMVAKDRITLHDGLVLPALADKQYEVMSDPSRQHRTKAANPDAGKSGSVNKEGVDPTDAIAIKEARHFFSDEEVYLIEAILERIPTWAASQKVAGAIKAQNELLEYQEKRALVIEAEQVEMFWSEKLALVKTKLMAVPRKMAQQISALVLRYASEFGRELAQAVAAIKKKKSGSWKYDNKTGGLALYSGKGKKPFALVTINTEAPEHAESTVINDTEKALTSEVSGALNELVDEKQEG